MPEEQLKQVGKYWWLFWLEKISTHAYIARDDSDLDKAPSIDTRNRLFLASLKGLHLFLFWHCWSIRYSVAMRNQNAPSRANLQDEWCPNLCIKLNICVPLPPLMQWIFLTEFPCLLALRRMLSYGPESSHHQIHLEFCVHIESIEGNLGKFWEDIILDEE